MKLIKTSLGILILSLMACCSSTKTTTGGDTQATTSEAKMAIEKMEAEGFLKGVIVASDADGDCAFVIKVENKEQTSMYDPINLDNAYMKDGVKVWFKYGGLRMMNRCEKASPISIVEIQKRGE